jgi:hypothetical protein
MHLPLRGLLVGAAVVCLAAVAVAVAYLTATSYLIMPTRSGLPCYHASPPCPPFSSAPIHYFEPNWSEGIGVAIIVGVACVVIARLVERHGRSLRRG